MAADMLYGGAAHFLGYRIKKKASPSASDGYDIVQADGTTAATGPSHATLIVVDYIEQSQYAPDSNGLMKVTLDNYDVAEAMLDSLNLLAKKPGVAAGTAPAPIKMETSAEYGGSETSEVPKFVWLGAGPVSTVQTTKRMGIWGVGQCDLSSGAIIFKDGQWIKLPIIVNGFNLDYGVSIPVGLWPSGLFGAVGTLAVPQYDNYQRDYLLKA